MKNAESPSLRQKAASFAARVTDGKCDHSDRVIRGIEKSTWDVLLSTIKMPTRPRKGGHDVKRVASNTEPRSGTGFCEPNIPLPAIEKEERDGVALIATSPGTHGQTGDHEMRQSFFWQRSPKCLESQQYSLPEMQASNAALLLGPHYCYTEAEVNHTFNSLDNKPLMDGMEYSFTADATVWNHNPWPVDVGSLTTFDEWLCPSESAPEHLGISYQAYGDVDASFYKS